MSAQTLVGPRPSRLLSGNARLRVALQGVLWVVAYGVLYVALDWVSYVEPVFKLDITPWNPQAGLTLALLLVRGPRWCAAVAPAAFASEVLVRDMPADLYVLLGASMCIACGYGALAIVLRRSGMPRHLESPGAVVRLILGAVPVTLVIATGYVVLFVAAGALPEDATLASIVRYWVGDVIGVLTLTPLLLYVDRWREGWQAVRRHWRLSLAQLGTVALLMWVIFDRDASYQVRFFYLLFVPVIWIALRWGVPGTTLSTLGIQIGVIIAVQANPPTVMDLQFLLLTLSATALLLGAVVTERERAVKQRRRAEIQLRERESALARAMRFAVAGELASALAHELNQPITALVSYLQASEILAAPFASQDERLGGTLAKAAQEALRASEVLRRLRDFYRGGEIKRERLDMATLVAATIEGFQERFQAGRIRLSIDVPATLPSLETGATQLQMVLHNLLSNALDALSAQDPAARHIRIAARAAAPEVRLSVEDSGPGVSEDIAQRVFEPFVTSKVDGMGLGLAISRSLLRAQGGDLVYAQGREWGGACFIARLPLGCPTDPGVSTTLRDTPYERSDRIRRR